MVQRLSLSQILNFLKMQYPGILEIELIIRSNKVEYVTANKRVGTIPVIA
jgi:hypothetical protein